MKKKNFKVNRSTLFVYQIKNSAARSKAETDPTTTMITSSVTGILTVH